jgi:hypothetical protein
VISESSVNFVNIVNMLANAQTARTLATDAVGPTGPANSRYAIPFPEDDATIPIARWLWNQFVVGSLYHVPARHWAPVIKYNRKGEKLES